MIPALVILWIIVALIIEFRGIYVNSLPMATFGAAATLAGVMAAVTL